MKNSRLMALLGTLTNKEARLMRQFVKSPFFNKREEVSILYDYLVECVHIHQIIPSKEAAYKHILIKLKIKQPYDDQQMRLWMSFLLKLTEKYLIHDAFFEDDIVVKTKLAKIYRERNLPKHLQSTFKELEKLQKKYPYRNATYYSNDLQIQLEQHHYITATNRISELNLQEILDDLDIAYLSKRLRQSCLALSHQTVYKTNYELGLIQEILDYIEQKELVEIPAIGVYYYAFQTLNNTQEQTCFRQFKNAIEIHGSKIPADELGDLYLLAINFCIKKYNEGSREYMPDQFELYQQGITMDLFLVDQKLSRFTYRNVVTIGLVLQEYEWVENFIHTYKNKLVKKYQESIFSFCLANLTYSRQKYEEALDLLEKSVYKDLLLNLAAKTVMLKIFYEQDELDRLEAHLEAMRTFIRRKQIMGYHRANYLNLIAFVKKLLDCNPYIKTEKIALKAEIELKKAIAEKDWLLKQF